MAKEWSNQKDRAVDSDKLTAATLAAALVTSGHIALPASIEKAARQAALAAEARGSAVRVLIGQPESDHLTEVFPDRNAGLIADVYDLTRHANDEQGRLAGHIVALLYPAELFRRAG